MVGLATLPLRLAETSTALYGRFFSVRAGIVAVNRVWVYATNSVDIIQDFVL